MQLVTPWVDYSSTTPVPVSAALPGTCESKTGQKSVKEYTPGTYHVHRVSLRKSVEFAQERNRFSALDFSTTKGRQVSNAEQGVFGKISSRNR